MSIFRDSINADLVEVDNRGDWFFAFVPVPGEIDIGGFNDEAGIFDELRPGFEAFGGVPFDVVVMFVPGCCEISILTESRAHLLRMLRTPF